MNPNKPTAARKNQPMTPQEMQLATEVIVRELGANINAAIREFFPGSKFALLVFPANNPDAINYIANANRAVLARALKKTAKKLNSAEDTPTEPTSIH